jgi:hypothetical protein
MRFDSGSEGIHSRFDIHGFTSRLHARYARFDSGHLRFDVGRTRFDSGHPRLGQDICGHTQDTHGLI